MPVYLTHGITMNINPSYFKACTERCNVIGSHYILPSSRYWFNKTKRLSVMQLLLSRISRFSLNRENKALTCLLYDLITTNKTYIWCIKCFVLQKNYSKINTFKKKKKSVKSASDFESENETMQKCWQRFSLVVTTFLTETLWFNHLNIRIFVH